MHVYGYMCVYTCMCLDVCACTRVYEDQRLIFNCSLPESLRRFSHLNPKLEYRLVKVANLLPVCAF